MQTADVESNQPDSSDRQRIISAEQIRAQYANMPGAFVGSAVTATFMAAVLYEKLPLRATLPWLAAAYVNSGIRFALWKWFQRVNPATEDTPRWGWYAVLFAALAGVIWGADGIVLNIRGNLCYQVIVLLVTSGLAFTSTYTCAPFLSAYQAFVYPTFVLSAVPFLVSGDTWRIAIGLGTLAFLPLVLRYAGGLSRALQASIEVRLQNAELVERLRAKKKALEEANIAKSHFLAVASHDLRQPLHALALFVQALEDSTLPDHAQHLVGNVRRCVDSMEELFDALLDISRLDAGAVRVRIETIPLAQVFERLSFEYVPVARQKGLSLRVMETSVYVRSDPTLFARIVRNLVANAVRYTDCGRITIGCRRRGDRVSVEVWDTGPGIPAEKHTEIFQEFTQLGNPERDRRKGLGLGLAIVERLAKLLDHGVELRSKLGSGSVFAITVPRGHYDDLAILDSQTTACFDFKGRLALLIQGEPAGRKALQELLSTWSCEVIAAGSGAEMMSRLGDLGRLPDIIIADNHVCGESGAAVVEMLRNEFNADVPALLIGGTAGLVMPAEGREGLPVLHPPFNPGRLRTLIKNLLHTPVARTRRAS